MLASLSNFEAEAPWRRSKVPEVVLKVVIVGSFRTKRFLRTMGMIFTLERRHIYHNAYTLWRTSCTGSRALMSSCVVGCSDHAGKKPQSQAGGRGFETISIAGDGFCTPMAPLPIFPYHARFYDTSCVLVHAFMEIGVRLQCYVLSSCLLRHSEGNMCVNSIPHPAEWCVELGRI
jgi:hypothetical protein